MSSSDTLKHVKIAFMLDKDGSESSALNSEHLWAVPLGDDRYRVANIPFFVYDLALDDVVEARHDAGSHGRLTFTRVVERGGHATFRMLVEPPEGSANASVTSAVKLLVDAGCGIQRGMQGGSLIALDVPPTTDIWTVRAVLELGKTSQTWTYEDAHIPFERLG